MGKNEEESSFYKNLGDSIKNARKKTGVSQEILAKHLGLSRISVVNIEKGKQKVQIFTLYEISNYLKTTLDDLMPQQSIDLMTNKAIEKNSKAGGDSYSLERLKGFLQKLKDNNPT